MSQFKSYMKTLFTSLEDIMAAAALAAGDDQGTALRMLQTR